MNSVICYYENIPEQELDINSNLQDSSLEQLISSKPNMVPLNFPASIYDDHFRSEEIGNFSIGGSEYPLSKRIKQSEEDSIYHYELGCEFMER
jgi:hypothetical protein